MVSQTYHLSVRTDDDGSLWGEVDELPGCFVAGSNMAEMAEAAEEAIALYLADDDDQPDNVVALRPRPHSVPRHVRPTGLILEG